MFRTNIAHRMGIRPRRYLERQSRSTESRVHTRCDYVVERCESESLVCVKQCKILRMSIVVAEENAYENSPKQPVDINLTLFRLMRPHEFRHLAIRAFILCFCRPSKELIELLKVDLLSLFR